MLSTNSFSSSGSRASAALFISFPLLRTSRTPELNAVSSTAQRRLPVGKKVITCAEEHNLESRTPLLELRNVSYQVPMNYDVHIFKDMNFKVYPGEFVIVIGGNGAGKSTGK